MNRENCFAYIAENYCYALREQDCVGCKFYKTKQQAKEEYFKYRGKVQKHIDKHFKSL